MDPITLASLTLAALGLSKANAASAVARAGVPDDLELAPDDRRWLERFFAGVNKRLDDLPGTAGGTDRGWLGEQFTTTQNVVAAWGRGLWDLTIARAAQTDDLLFSLENQGTLHHDALRAIDAGISNIWTALQAGSMGGGGGDLMPVLTDIRSAIDRLLPSSGGLAESQVAEVRSLFITSHNTIMDRLNTIAANVAELLMR